MKMFLSLILLCGLCFVSGAVGCGGNGYDGPLGTICTNAYVDEFFQDDGFEMPMFNCTFDFCRNYEENHCWHVINPGNNVIECECPCLFSPMIDPMEIPFVAFVTENCV